MTAISESANFAPDGRRDIRGSLGPAFLIYFHIVLCCVSLFYVAQHFSYVHISFDENRLYNAIVVIALAALISPMFTFANFSFGYFIGFYSYTMILGFLWLAVFSKFDYDHEAASLSAIASLVAFLLPALLIRSPIKQMFTVSERTLEHILSSVLILAAATIAIGALYNFRIVAVQNIYAYRGVLELPTTLSYFIGIASNALLPFAFACFMTRRNYLRAGVTLALLLLFYPVTLSKVALFSSIWLVAVLCVSKFFSTRTTVVLSLFLPMLVGVLIQWLGQRGFFYFSVINYRMIATPSSALDVYNDFFATHDRTYFCQINFLKSFVDCPYSDPLAIVFKNTYGIGNLNASLFATEGVASVGLFFAPLAAFVCGLIVALGNRVSAGLPPRFVLLSSAILPQVFLNVPITIALLTNGAFALFLLWYITPRSMFEQE
jgi:hypothetical protein